MLKRQHLERHQTFLQDLFHAKTVKALRKKLDKAAYLQLRSLFLVLASVALKKLPASAAVQDVFFKSRKKRLLRRTLRSWAHVRRILRSKNPVQWRQILKELAPLIPPVLSLFF